MTPTITAFSNSPDGGRALARDSRVRWALIPLKKSAKAIARSLTGLRALLSDEIDRVDFVNARLAVVKMSVFDRLFGSGQRFKQTMGIH